MIFKNTLVLRYIIKENLFPFYNFYICMYFFISIDLIELIRRSSSKNIEFTILLKWHYFTFLTLSYNSSYSFLLSSMNTYMRLNKNNELSVLRASGFSIWSLILPTIINVTIVSILFLFIFNPVFSYMNLKFKSLENSFFKGSSGLYSVSQTGLWLREKNDEFEYVINSKLYIPEEQKLQNVKIFKFDLNNKFLERINVENIIMLNTEIWELNDGYRLEINKLPMKFDKLELFINLDAKKIERNFRPPESIGFWELDDYIKNLEKSGFSVRKHVVYKNYLYSYPLILLSMVLLGCLLSIKKIE